MKQKIFFISFLLLISSSAGFSQIISAPDLQCVENDAANGNITLSWTNPPVNPCGAFVQYTIHASSNGPGGPYDSIIPVPLQSSTSIVISGYLAFSSTWYFYIEADYNCPGASVLQSDTINNLSPITPEIINVDVTPGGNVIFNWIPSVSPQTFFYVIYYYLPNGNAVPLDTVFGRFNTTYTDIKGDPTAESLVYTIAASDSCNKISSFSTLPHNTIFAKAATASCQSQVTLTWNRYINFPQGVKEYQIWVSKDSGTLTMVGTVDSSTLTYNYTDFLDNDSLCMVVRAISAADTGVISNSNKICLVVSIVRPPAYNYITNATVDIDNHIRVTWLIDTLAELTYYLIERSGNKTTYDPIDQFNVPIPLVDTQTYIDSNALPARNPYYYKITAVNSCQIKYVSPAVKTVCLTGELYDYYLNNLNWNDFELEGATVVKYNLYRNYGTGYQWIKTFPFGINTTTDSLQQFLQEKGIFCYRIEAVYDLSLPNGYQATLSSWSNELCIIHRPIIYIPTAFAPASTVPGNNVFKPTMVFNTEPKAYTLQIYNRWGAKVFESNEPSVGWDGTDHGKEAQAGAYAYLIQFYAADETKVERKGMVLLVK